MGTYMRVLPRDFFNEAKLLKCLGALGVVIHDGKAPKGCKITLELTKPQAGRGFGVSLDGHSNELYAANVTATINGANIELFTPYNSKDAYPLYCRLDGEETEVLDDNGNLSADFITRFSNQ